jgi:hypothetical protein
MARSFVSQLVKAIEHVSPSQARVHRACVVAEAVGAAARERRAGDGRSLAGAEGGTGGLRRRVRSVT